ATSGSFAGPNSNSSYGLGTPPVLTFRVDPPPVPDITVSDVSALENVANGTVVFTITLSQATTIPLTVSYTTGASGDTATAPSDYSSVSGSVTFQPGQTVKTVGVYIVNDSIYETDETYTFALTGTTFGNITD